MSYVEANLMSGEQAVYRTSLHWLMYFWPIVLAVVGLVMLLLGTPTLAVTDGAALGRHEALDEPIVNGLKDSR